VLCYVLFVYFCGFYLDLYNYLYIFYLATCKRLKCPSFGHSIRVNSTVIIYSFTMYTLIGLNKVCMYMNCAKTSEPIAMPFVGLTRVGPRKHIVDGVQIPVERVLLRGGACAGAL